MYPKGLRGRILSWLAVASATALAGCSQGSRDSKHLAQPAGEVQTDTNLDVPEPIVPAEVITRAFAQDKASADRKYGVGAEDIRIRGTVAEIIRVKGMSITHVMLKGHDPGDGQEPPRIQCTLKNPDGGKNVDPGDVVTLEGISSGEMLGRIKVMECAITDVKHRP